jgi:4-diphosphocytidyl-2-C-methyl-D-erythritol kinase
VRIERSSPCKINLLLNILGRRQDGFHELETVMQPVDLCDRLSFELVTEPGVILTCSDPSLPVDAANLVYRAAARFIEAAGCPEGVQIHLEKQIPVAAGLGGGSGNAAVTLMALNELFGRPLDSPRVFELASAIGSDVPFFLEAKPALAMGRGERVEVLEPFSALQGAFVLLIHPGFGISTAWAYRSLANFPEALHGRPGRAADLIERLRGTGLKHAGDAFYNSLEAPALTKFPILALYQKALCEFGAAAVLMSGSGSTTFAIAEDRNKADQLRAAFISRFGDSSWTAVVAL